tara:strand:- start:383 stop:511 length:129 start_codon:yes stop_codon:yes gene_type:complete
MSQIDNNKIELLQNILENYKAGEITIDVNQNNPFQLQLTINN